MIPGRDLRALFRLATSEPVLPDELEDLTEQATEWDEGPAEGPTDSDHIPYLA